MSDDGWWDEYSYTRALIVTEPDPEVRAMLAESYGMHEEGTDE